MSGRLPVYELGGFIPGRDILQIMDGVNYGSLLFGASTVYLMKKSLEQNILIRYKQKISLEEEK